MKLSYLFYIIQSYGCNFAIRSKHRKLDQTWFNMEVLISICSITTVTAG